MDKSASSRGVSSAAAWCQNSSVTALWLAGFLPKVHRPGCALALPHSARPQSISASSMAPRQEGAHPIHVVTRHVVKFQAGHEFFAELALKARPYGGPHSVRQRLTAAHVPHHNWRALILGIDAHVAAGVVFTHLLASRAVSLIGALVRGYTVGCGAGCVPRAKCDQGGVVARSGTDGTVIGWTIGWDVSSAAHGSGNPCHTHSTKAAATRYPRPNIG